MTSPELVPATGSDLDALVELLREHDLPTGGVRDGPGEFYLCLDGETTLGGGGFERYDGAALLRSVVIRSDRQGEGHGRRLVEALLERARRDGAREAWLLTTTAAPFFAGLGFERVPRESAPAGVRSSTEFAEVCPDSAACMVRPLVG